MGAVGPASGCVVKAGQEAERLGESRGRPLGGTAGVLTPAQVPGHPAVCSRERSCARAGVLLLSQGGTWEPRCDCPVAPAQGQLPFLCC